MDWAQLQADFRQKYENCYCNVLLEGHSKSQVFCLNHVEATNAAPLLHLRNQEFGEIILKYDDSHSELEFKLPTIGLYNYKKSVIMVRRLYARQYKKGLCNGTVQVMPIYHSVFHGFAAGGESQWSEELVKTILTPTSTISLTEGINALAKVLGICLSSEFAVGLSPRERQDTFILWYHENPIGTVDPKSRRLHLRETQFKQEFHDFVDKIKGTDDYLIHS